MFAFSQSTAFEALKSQLSVIDSLQFYSVSRSQALELLDSINGDTFISSANTCSYSSLEEVDIPVRVKVLEALPRKAF